MLTVTTSNCTRHIAHRGVLLSGKEGITVYTIALFSVHISVSCLCHCLCTSGSCCLSFCGEHSFFQRSSSDPDISPCLIKLLDLNRVDWQNRSTVVYRVVGVRFCLTGARRLARRSIDTPCSNRAREWSRKERKGRTTGRPVVRPTHGNDE